MSSRFLNNPWRKRGTDESLPKSQFPSREIWFRTVERSVCPRFLPPAARFALALVLAAIAATAGPRTLRVCADPNNLPYSNQKGEGFENRIAELIARDLDSGLEYTWWSEHRSFLRNTLGEGRCDVVIGVPSTLDTVTVTQPYYRSTYVFVTRQDRNVHPAGLTDPRLAGWRIGIHMVGDDYAPPAAALSANGAGSNIQGFSLYGAYGEENPPARLIEAVAKGEVDVAIAWGPQAGYFAAKESTPLAIEPVQPASFRSIPFTFDISMAVRKGNQTLKAELDGALQRHCQEIQAILHRFNIPQVPKEESNPSCGPSPLSAR